MNNSNSPSDPPVPRVTLKLKSPARKPSVEPKPQPASRLKGKSESKPGAHWSDEYKQRMQADMDELASS